MQFEDKFESELCSHVKTSYEAVQVPRSKFPDHSVCEVIGGTEWTPVRNQNTHLRNSWYLRWKILTWITNSDFPNIHWHQENFPIKYRSRFLLGDGQVSGNMARKSHTKEIWGALWLAICDYHVT